MRKLKKICFEILVLFFITLFTSKVNAFSMTSSTNKKVVTTGEKVIYTINFDETILTTDFKLSYDSELLEYAGSMTDNIDVNDSKENNNIHILYADETGIGTSEVNLLFIVKKSFISTHLKILNMNVHTKDMQKSYTVNDSNLLEKFTIQSLEYKEYIKDEENDLAPNVLPNTGIREENFIIIFVLVLLIILILAHKNLKLKKLLSFVLFIFLISDAKEIKAYDTNFVGIYDRIYGHQKIIAIMLKEESEKISYEELKNYLPTELSIKNVTNSDNEDLSTNSNVATGHNVIFTNDDSYKVVLYGDINEDGIINSNDIAEIIENNLNKKQLTDIQRKAANLVNSNDKKDLLIDTHDIDRLKEYILNRLEDNLVDELPEELKVTGIEIKKQPAKISYIKGEELDLTGGEIAVKYEDGTSTSISMTEPGVVVSGYNSNNIGQQNITVTYENHKASLKITVHDYIDKIKLTKTPNKVTYLQNESFDPTGMVITAVYASGDTPNITNDKNLSITTKNTELNNNINNLTVLGKQLLDVKYWGVTETGKEDNIELDSNQNLEITVSVNKRNVTSVDGYRIDSKNATDYQIPHYTSKKYVSQGSCRFVYNDVTYIMCARINGENEEGSTSLYILDNNKKVQWVIDDRSYGHANSMTWNYNTDGNYIYILRTYSSDDTLAFIDRIDINKMMAKIKVESIGTVVSEEGFSDNFVNTYTMAKETDYIPMNITYDRFSNKIYGTTRKDNFRLSELTLDDENNTFKTYANNSTNLEHGLVETLDGYVKFVDKGANAGFCIAEDYVLFGRYISETGSPNGTGDTFLDSLFSAEERKNYIDVFKREKNGEIYSYTYIGTYVIDQNILIGSNSVVGELESLVYVSKNIDAKTIVIEALINTQGDYEKYLRIYLTDLIN